MKISGEEWEFVVKWPWSVKECRFGAYVMITFESDKIWKEAIVCMKGTSCCSPGISGESQAILNPLRILWSV
jgi:hypothetical protein